MLTEEQKNWLDRLPDTDHVEILPYNPQAKEVFEQQQAELKSILGSTAVVLHKGATAWGISGKGDVDIYVPVTVEKFDGCFEQLRQVLGEPGSHYLYQRVRWNRRIQGIEVEILLVNQEAEFYRNNVRFWDCVEARPDVLEEYRRVKEAAAGTSTREYFTRKALFISSVLQSVTKADSH